jgi:hypothetical protein
MEAEDDDHHHDIDGSNKVEAPLHEAYLCERFEKKTNYNKHHYVETRQCGKVSIHIKPESTGHVEDKYQDCDDDGGFTAKSGFCQGKQEKNIHDG